MLRVALVGYGYAGRTFHAPLLRATPGVELVVVVSSKPEQVRQDRRDIETVPSPAAAFARGDFELVVIATPNVTHASLAEQALGAGKHVVVDKPFTVTLDEARRVVARSAEAGRLLTVFHNRRWDADFLGLKAVVAERTLGDVTHVESHFDRFRPEVRPRWREESGPGSGLWFDLGPHLIDQALQLFGLPDALTASLATQRPGGSTDDWAHAILYYGERRVILHASALAAARLPRFIVNGTRGSWIKFGLDVQEQQLLAGMRPGDAGWGQDEEPALVYDGSGHAPSTRPVPSGDYRDLYAQVRDAIVAGGPNPVPPAQAVAVMAVLETAARSSEAGRTLTVPLTDEERQAAALNSCWS